MNDYSINMFYVPLLHLEVRNWKVKKQKFKELINLSNLTRNEKDEFILTDFHQSNDKNNHIIESLLKEELNIFKSNFSLTNCQIHYSWFEKSKKNDFHGTHNHGAIGYSSVCYIEYDEQLHTPTKFLSPFCNFVTGEGMMYSPYNVSEGSLIFFPSQINHWTLPNTSDKDRIILSFNLSVS